MTGVVTRLTLLAACCGLLVGSANFLTRDTIAVNRAAFDTAQLLQVVGRRQFSVTRMNDKLYQLRNPSGELAGFVFDASTEQGYNGHISLWIGTDLTGRIIGVRVKTHHETPGLGDKIELEISPWILEFNGKSLANPSAWTVKRDGGQFDQFTGATITPRAVVHAVRDGLAGFAQQKARWIREANREL